MSKSRFVLEGQNNRLLKKEAVDQRRANDPVFDKLESYSRDKVIKFLKLVYSNRDDRIRAKQQMATSNTETAKKHPIFICEFCDFKLANKVIYTRHLFTRKR